jgi:hypothetical protein
MDNVDQVSLKQDVEVKEILVRSEIYIQKLQSLMMKIIGIGTVNMGQKVLKNVKLLNLNNQNLVHENQQIHIG